MSENEVIIGIEEVTGWTEAPHEDGYVPWGTRAGYKITTDAQEILLLIDDYQSCCESWGYFITEDDTDKFLAADLLGIKITDINRSTRHVFSSGYDEIKGDNREHIMLDSGDVMFVDIETSRGNLQFAAYNAHNGYYGHGAYIISAQLNHEQTL